MSEAGRVTDLVRATVEPILLSYIGEELRWEFIPTPMMGPTPDGQMGLQGVASIFALYTRSPNLTEGWLQVFHQSVNPFWMIDRANAETVISEMVAVLLQQRNQRLELK